ncbi:RinA family protein [Fructobacillus sp. M158]|uniref:RinA family protein n=1 Tax=Fructobacillus parabroussonetiae TaxID=2713174 RepID=UPI00200B8668|nr:RinA family protein [Fructobacillus parabroussonetiae]MCK8617801.1 RinA family protein [Fructobacillus parabroussonetiae]
MADEVDHKFKMYFSGAWENNLKWRLFELENQPKKADDNIGGGRIENVNTAKNAVELKVARKIDDPIVHDLTMRIESMEHFLKLLTERDIKMLQLRFKKRPEKWDVVSAKLFRSARRLRADMKRVKEEYRKGIYWID